MARGWRHATTAMKAASLYFAHANVAGCARCPLLLRMASDCLLPACQAVFEGDSQPEIFTQQILQGPGHAMAKNALADIQDKHRDILALEASIAELHQLFVDMSVLVSTQACAKRKPRLRRLQLKRWCLR